MFTRYACAFATDPPSAKYTPLKNASMSQILIAVTSQTVIQFLNILYLELHNITLSLKYIKKYVYIYISQ